MMVNKICIDRLVVEENQLYVEVAGKMKTWGAFRSFVFSIGDVHFGNRHGEGHEMKGLEQSQDATMLWTVVLLTKPEGVFVTYAGNELLDRVLVSNVEKFTLKNVPVFNVDVETGHLAKRGVAWNFHSKGSYVIPIKEGKCVENFTFYDFQRSSTSNLFGFEPPVEYYDKAELRTNGFFFWNGTQWVGERSPTSVCQLSGIRAMCTFNGKVILSTFFDRRWGGKQVICSTNETNEIISRCQFPLVAAARARSCGDEEAFKIHMSMVPTEVFVYNSDYTKLINYINVENNTKLNEFITTTSLLGKNLAHSAACEIGKELLMIANGPNDGCPNFEEGTVIARSKKPNDNMVTIHTTIDYAYFDLERGVVVVSDSKHVPIQQWIDTIYEGKHEETTGTIEVFVNIKTIGEKRDTFYWRPRFIKDKRNYLFENVKPVNKFAKKIVSIGLNSYLNGVLVIGESLCEKSVPNLEEIKKHIGPSEFGDRVVPFLKGRPKCKIVYGWKENGEEIFGISTPNQESRDDVFFIYVPTVRSFGDYHTEKGQKLVGFLKPSLTLDNNTPHFETHLTKRVFGDFEELKISKLKEWSFFSKLKGLKL